MNPLLLSFVLLLHTVLVSVQPARDVHGDTPKAIAMAYYAALQDDEGKELVALLDSETLTSFKARLMPSLANAAASSDSVLRAELAKFIGERSLDELKGISPADFTRTIYSTMAKDGATPTHGRIPRVVGHLSDGKNQIRVVVDFLEESILVDWPAPSTTVLTLRREGSRWKVAFPQELDWLANYILTQLGPNAFHIRPSR